MKTCEKCKSPYLEKKEMETKSILICQVCGHEKELVCACVSKYGECECEECFCENCVCRDMKAQQRLC